LTTKDINSILSTPSLSPDSKNPLETAETQRTSADFTRMSPNRQKHRDAFVRIGQAVSKRGVHGPTLFNPHYAIKGRAVQDRSVSSATGPQLRTLQWEAHGGFLKKIGRV
jgi:hypothetical protein